MSTEQMAECSGCFEVKQLTKFTTGCRHQPSLCHDCIALSLTSQIQNANLDQLRCPECHEPLAYDQAQNFVAREIFEQYQRQSIDRLVSKIHNFVWCPLGCGRGQIHHAGPEQPLILCLNCNRHFCFRHQVAWHHNHTCDEYDAFLADPRVFRSKAQIERAAAEARDLEDHRLSQQIRDAETRFSQSLLREEEAAEARRRERAEQARRLAREQAERMEAERRAREARQLAARLAQEEAETGRVFHALSKPCPRCRIPIQRNGGCDHMICGSCFLNFSWKNARW
ncbi:hypothetical protein F4779DRAFT_576474 [Xylariaceae sp. FL0662B]|nr:hypothetical protein F4779DRAFT_576474 [Xylariaceae sp. FL0662B]